MRMRSIVISVILALTLFTVGFDSQPALKNQADEIDTALKAIEKRISGGGHLDFQQSDIQGALAKLGKLSIDLSKASIHADANKSGAEVDVITSVGAQYMSELYSFYVIYARAAHTLSANTPDFNFDKLSAYTLKLKASTAINLLKQKPFNSRHLNTDVLEFFINSQDKQMAEFFALTSPKDELTYAKLIQFSALRETYTNLWAIQRITSNEIPVQQVNSCAPELISFRAPPSGNLKESEPFQELNASDRYNGLSKLIDGIFQKTLTLPLLPQTDYYELLGKTLTTTAEFKTYMNGVEPQNVSKWLNDVAASVTKVVQNDWQGNSKNSLEVLGESTLMSDKLSTGEIAHRMAEIVFDRQETAAIAQISAIAADKVKVTDLPGLSKKLKDQLDAGYRAQWTSQAEQQLSSQTANLDQSALKNNEASQRQKEKIDETLQLASVLMPAVHDYELIDKSFGIPVERPEDVPRVQKESSYIYLRNQFKLSISDPDTLKSYLLKEIQNQTSLWVSLQKNQTAMLLLNTFFVQVADDFKKIIDAQKITSQDQAARALLAVAQSAANGLIQKSAPTGQRLGFFKIMAQSLDISTFTSSEGLIDSLLKAHSVFSQQSDEEAPQKLLQKSFATIGLLNAHNPTDLEPLTPQQKDLADIVIAQGYELNPLLAVRTNGPTVLERIYTEGLEANGKNQLDWGVGGRIVLDGIQTAAQDIQGKLEDFCQANVANPARDLRFRKLFKSASNLRQAIMHSQGAGNSEDLAKFDKSLTEKTQTTTEKVINKFINPAFKILSAVMILVLIISVLNPMTTIPALASLMVIANFGMIGLSAVSSYFEVSSLFFEQPAQIRYQEALASAQVSADEPFQQWDQLKSMGLISTVTNRASADQAKQALVTSQLMQVPQLAMNAWIGYGGLKQVASNIGLTGMMKYKELAGAEMPGWADRPAPPVAKTFSENLRELGTAGALKEKATQVAGVVKSVVGLNPAFGTYTSEEALGALKTALARVLPEEAKEILPEVQLYRDFLKARLKISNGASTLTYLTDGTISAPAQVIDEEMPEFIKTNSNLHAYEDSGVRTADGAGQILTDTGKPLDHVRKFWTDTPQIEGGLSWKEMIENPQLLKWRLIPKSALKAARAGTQAFDLWVKQYGSVVKLIDLLRGQLIAQKLEIFESLVTKLEGLSSQGMSTAEALKSLNAQEMALLQEAAHGPRLLAYGYWAAKSAERSVGALPLRQSIDVFDNYNTMIQSLKPNDWTPPADTAKASSADQADVRNFYRLAKTMDSAPDAPNMAEANPKIITLEAGIERTLFRHAN